LDHVRRGSGESGRFTDFVLLWKFQLNQALKRHEHGSWLAERHTVVVPDLRGYGRSSTPADDAEHTVYSKRRMAADVVAVMDALGHDRFAVVGHDRGGRVAYRLALDTPEAVRRLTVMDVIPTGDVWARAIVSVLPFGTVMSPWVTCGLAAAVQVSSLASDPAGCIVGPVVVAGHEATASGPASGAASLPASFVSDDGLHARTKRAVRSSVDFGMSHWTPRQDNPRCAFSDIADLTRVIRSRLLRWRHREIESRLAPWNRDRSASGTCVPAPG